MFPSDPLEDIEQASENVGQYRALCWVSVNLWTLWFLFICLSHVDIAQVQCIKSYKAQEHDELTLEKADILHSKTITSDGKSLNEVFLFHLQPAHKETKHFVIYKVCVYVNGFKGTAENEHFFEL